MRKTVIVGIALWLSVWGLPAFAAETLQYMATATGAGNVVQVPDQYQYQTIQVTISGTSATVQCQGSLDNKTFETLGSLTATGACVTEGAWRFVRANISACSSCLVSAIVDFAQ